jgi:hypothetical protein
MSASPVAACTEPPDPCDEILQQILEFMQNLQKRYWDLRNDVLNLPQSGPDSIEGHQHQFEGRQEGLRNRLNDYNTDNCGPPPEGAWDWATKEAPSPDPKPTSDATRTAEAAAGAGAAVGVGYVIYRIIRMIPSLFPPLWPTIPENALIP